MAGHRTLTHLDKLAIRRLHLQNSDVSKSLIAERLNISRASIYRVLEGITRDPNTPAGAYPELREAYVRESSDPTEIGWVHVWLASLEAENKLLNAAYAGTQQA